MPSWRRRPRVPPAVPPVVAGPEPGPAPPPPPAVDPPPDAAAVAVRLTEAGVGPPPVELLGTAGGTSVWGWEEPSGSAALQRWRVLRAVHGRTGLWPVLLGSREEAAATLGPGTDDHDGEALAEGLALSPGRVLADLSARVTGPPDDPGPLGERPRLPRVLDELPEEFELPESEAVLGLVPAAAGWEVPARLSWWGAVNVDLTPAEHLCVLRWWEHRYGAELVALGSDTLQLAVARPPRAASDVLQAALEMYSYCADSVDQGWGTLEGLCREMAPARSWTFWWD